MLGVTRELSNYKTAGERVGRACPCGGCRECPTEVNSWGCQEEEALQGLLPPGGPYPHFPVRLLAAGGCPVSCGLGISFPAPPGRPGYLLPAWAASPTALPVKLLCSKQGRVTASHMYFLLGTHTNAGPASPRGANT